MKAHRSLAPVGALLAPDEWSRLMSGFVDELRSPVSNLVTLADLMRRHGSNPTSTEARLASNLLQLTRHLHVLVDDAASLLRLLRGEPRVQLQEIVLRDLVDRVERVARSEGWERGVSVATRVAPGLPATISTDPDLVLAAVRHLLETATSLADRELELCVAARGRQLVFRAAPDVGCEGLEPLDAMLDPFAGRSARVLKERGARALALLLAREQARVLGGDLVFVDGDPRRACEMLVPLSPRGLSSPGRGSGESSS